MAASSCFGASRSIRARTVAQAVAAVDWATSQARSIAAAGWRPARLNKPMQDANASTPARCDHRLGPAVALRPEATHPAQAARPRPARPR